MTRRHVLTLIAIPSFVAGLGVAAFELSDAAGRASCCQPGSGCCGVEAAATEAPSGSDSCCPTSCCTTAGAAESK